MTLPRSEVEGTGGASFIPLPARVASWARSTGADRSRPLAQWRGEQAYERRQRADAHEQGGDRQ